MYLTPEDEMRLLRERVAELTAERDALRALLGQRCDGIDCDKGEECVRLVKERDAFKAQVERVRSAVDAVLLRGNGWPAAAREAAQAVLDALEGKS